MLQCIVDIEKKSQKKEKENATRGKDKSVRMKRYKFLENLHYPSKYPFNHK